MAKAVQLEQKLADLSALNPAAPDSLPRIRQALADKSNLVVAKAAQLATRLLALHGELEQTFFRLLAAGTSADKGCFAKNAIAKVLYESGGGSADLFLKGIHHVQLEPVFGGHADTARELRGLCALGLVRVGYHDAIAELADLLCDPEQQARIMAARALAYSDQKDAALPLRVRVLSGEPSAEVMGECFAALLKLAPESSLNLLARFLDSENRDIAGEAAIALGSSRQARAGRILMDYWKANPTRRADLASPIAMLRTPEAIDLLVDAIESCGETIASAAVDALGMYRTDEALRQRVMAAVDEQSRPVRDAAAKAFPA